LIKLNELNLFSTDSKGLFCGMPILGVQGTVHVQSPPPPPPPQHKRSTPAQRRRWGQEEKNDDIQI